MSGEHKNLDGGKDRKEKTMKKRHGLFFGFAVLMITAIFTLTGCDTSGGDDDIWLKDLQNPFIGKWESRIPSMDNAKMVSEYKTDGTFTCGFPEVPGYEGPFDGGYIVTGNIMVTYLDFEGVAGYTFTVVDNNTVNVTEIDEVKEGGELILGNTSPFTRVAGSSVNKENKPIVLSHQYLGKWKFDADVPIPPDNLLVHYLVVFEMRTDGIMNVDYDVTGGPNGRETEGYFIYNNGTSDLLVLFEEDAGFSAEPISFASDDTIIVNYEGMPLPCTRIP
jgi:hypothetical protein